MADLVRVQSKVIDTLFRIANCVQMDEDDEPGVVRGPAAAVYGGESGVFLLLNGSSFLSIAIRLKKDPSNFFFCDFPILLYFFTMSIEHRDFYLDIDDIIANDRVVLLDSNLRPLPFDSIAHRYLGRSSQKRFLEKINLSSFSRKYELAGCITSNPMCFIYDRLMESKHAFKYCVNVFSDMHSARLCIDYLHKIEIFLSCIINDNRDYRLLFADVTFDAFVAILYILFACKKLVTVYLNDKEYLCIGNLDDKDTQIYLFCRRVSSIYGFKVIDNIAYPDEAGKAYGDLNIIKRIDLSKDLVQVLSYNPLPHKQYFKSQGRLEYVHDSGLLVQIHSDHLRIYPGGGTSTGVYTEIRGISDLERAIIPRLTRLGLYKDEMRMYGKRISLSLRYSGVSSRF
ncbi:MAG: hypothetical protein QXS54_02620 [Candidatus Methanomethylicaceae archaeon]